MGVLIYLDRRDGVYETSKHKLQKSMYIMCSIITEYSAWHWNE